MGRCRSGACSSPRQAYWTVRSTAMLRQVFQLRSLSITREFEIKFEVERNLHKTSPSKHYQLLPRVRLSAIRDPNSIEGVRGETRMVLQEIAYSDDIPLLVTGLSRDSGGGWGDRDRDIDVHLAVLWQDMESVDAIRKILEGWNIRSIKLNPVAPLQRQVQEIVQALTRDAAINPTRLRRESITRSHRSLLLSPGITGEILTNWQRFAQRVLGQEIGISTVIDLRTDGTPDDSIRRLYETGRFDWVAFCPASESFMDWLPYLALEYDGCKPLNQAKEEAKNSICRDAGLPLVRCSYKDFKNAKVDEHFQRDFARFVLFRARPARERSTESRSDRPRSAPSGFEVDSQDVDVTSWRYERFEAQRAVEKLEEAQIDIRVCCKEEFRWTELWRKSKRASWKKVDHSPKMRMKIYSPEDIFGKNESDEFLERWILRRYLRRHYSEEQIPISPV